jgi:hypothetical protein
MGRRVPSSLFRVGVHRHGAATVDHGDELGTSMIRLGLDLTMHVEAMAKTIAVLKLTNELEQ